MKSLKSKIAGKAFGKLISQMMKEGNFTFTKEKYLSPDTKERKETETK